MYCSAIGESAGHVFILQPTPPPLQTLPSLEPGPEPEPETELEPTPNILDTVPSASTAISPVTTRLRIDFEPETPDSGVGDVSNLDLTESSPLASPLNGERGQEADVTPDPSLRQSTDTESDDEGELIIIETEHIPAEIKQKRIICDFFYVVKQARELELHNTECSGRYFAHKVLQKGLEYVVTFKCNNILCSKPFMDVKTVEDGSCLNSLAVLGALSTGSGHDQEEEKFATMNMAYMSQPTFAKYEKVDVATLLAGVTDEQLREALAEEIALALERGDIDENGIPCITVIIDGGWCKRTYGHGYNAASGVVSINLT